MERRENNREGVGIIGEAWELPGRRGNYQENRGWRVILPEGLVGGVERRGEEVVV